MTEKRRTEHKRGRGEPTFSNYVFIVVIEKKVTKRDARETAGEIFKEKEKVKKRNDGICKEGGNEKSSQIFD